MKNELSANMKKALVLISAGPTSVEGGPYSPLKPHTVNALEKRGLVRVVAVTAAGGDFSYPAVYRAIITKRGRAAL